VHSKPRSSPKSPSDEHAHIQNPNPEPGTFPDDAQAEHPRGEPSQNLSAGEDYGNVDYEYRRRHYGDNVGKHVAGPAVAKGTLSQSAPKTKASSSVEEEDAKGLVQRGLFRLSRLLRWPGKGRR